MSAPDFGSCTEGELWRFVAAHLARRDIETVLVGGAVVAVYSRGAYRSGDLDFLRVDMIAAGDVRAAMEEIGFEYREDGYFVHPECGHLFVQFVKGPLGIGGDGSIVPAREVFDGVELKILSPSDCVCDRLAAYVYDRARECLDQALLVAQAQALDWTRIERWCRAEGDEARKAYAELRHLAGA